jgi:pimeloyl-ACP methyl ester carboxylesterase
MQLTSRLSGRTNNVASAGGPLVVAIHGGTYTSAYFDLPGRSLLAQGVANGMAIVAIDRPGYADCPMLAPEAMDIAGQAAFLRDALGEVWRAHGEGRAGVVLVGHSIGAAIAATIAASAPDWPLIGLAISGVGLTTNPGDHERWLSLPDIPLVAMPDEIKDHVMFGPEGSYDTDMPAASHAANTTAPKAELLAITGPWHGVVHDVLGRIAVPVHYRQAEFDRLWIVDQGEVDGFARALTSSPLVDARMVQGTGHCIDFHRVGPAFQLQQLGFALECGSR